MPDITTETAMSILSELDADPQNALHAKAAAAIRDLLEIRAADLKTGARDAVDADLSARMVKAGMVPLDALTRGSGLSRFIRHAGVQTPHDFTLWVTGKAKEYSRMQAAHQTGVHILDPDIEDFVLGKAAAFGEVLENARHVFSLPAPIDTQDTNLNP